MSDDINSSSMLGVDQLATALAKAQGAIMGASKSRTNPAFKSKYATLADVWDACREPLAANGLSIVQLVSATAGGVTVETRLLHASGQSLSSVLELPVGQRTAQGVGSAITYARRYGLAAMVGVAPDEDDDGAAASMHTRREEHREPPREQAPAYSAPVDTAKIDTELQSLVKQLHDVNRDNTVASLRKLAMLPAPPAKLTPEQKQVFLRTLTQRLRASEEDGPPDDDMPGWATPGGAS